MLPDRLRRRFARWLSTRRGRPDPTSEPADLFLAQDDAPAPTDGSGEPYEYELAPWHVTIERTGITTVRDAEERTLATVHGERDAVLGIATLMARAPSLHDATSASLEVFRMIAKHERGPAQLAAFDMIPMLEAALVGTEWPIASSEGGPPRHA